MASSARIDLKTGGGGVGGVENWSQKDDAATAAAAAVVVVCVEACCSDSLGGTTGGGEEDWSRDRSSLSFATRSMSAWKTMVLVPVIGSRNSRKNSVSRVVFEGPWCDCAVASSVATCAKKACNLSKSFAGISTEEVH